MRILVVLGLLLGSCATARATVWLAAVDSYAQRANPTSSAFMDLFAPGAPWDSAATKTQVLKVSTQFLHAATDTELSAVIHALENRHIALGMEGLLLVESARCGRGVESYGGAGAIQALAARVKRLGGTIDYVAMDEPLWYGNFVVGPRNCNDTVESLAQQMAPNVRTLKTAFPAIRFGDIEPINNRTIGRIEVMLQFARAFKAATGEPISFVDADIIWQENWKPQIVDWKVKLHAAGIAFGVIFDGDPTDTSDDAWTSHALERYRAVIADQSMKPDDMIFQSWMERPTRLLPDSEPATLTGLVRQATEQDGANARKRP
jgi:hypothetical protein